MAIATHIHICIYTGDLLVNVAYGDHEDSPWGLDHSQWIQHFLDRGPPNLFNKSTPGKLWVPQYEQPEILGSQMQQTAQTKWVSS